jgi:hypothetical protein
LARAALLDADCAILSSGCRLAVLLLLLFIFFAGGTMNSS